MLKPALALVSSVLLLTACGTATTDRVASGGLIGAGTGAVVGLPFGIPVTGAFVGAGVGMAVGGLTKKEQLYWGEPLWEPIGDR